MRGDILGRKTRGRAKMREMNLTSAAGIASGMVLVGAAAFAWSAGYPGAQIFGPTLRKTGEAHAIALTFDDGPNPAATPALLDLLERHGARGTFFLMGAHVRAFPELAREIAGRGHAIGNHTETHPNLALLGRAKLREELQRCREAIETAARVRPKWMRPPFGFRGPTLNGVVRELGYAGVAMWSRWAWDWKTQPAERVAQRLQRVRGGDIVLLHDGDHRRLEGDRRHTVEAVGYWLPRWKDSGIRFVSTDEIQTSRDGASGEIIEKAS